MKILLTAGTGIICMTAFSYLYSWIRKKPFVEPKLLNELLSRLKLFQKHRVESHPAGWLIHYAVGVLFVWAYAWLFQITGHIPTISTYVVLGIISGVIGILGWKITFKIHPRPPQIHFSEYYVHLLLAHVMFGLGVWLGNYMTRDL